MVKLKSTTRFLSIEHAVILEQTDTTVGFSSQNHKILSEIKSRSNSKPFIKVYSSLRFFLACGNRIPHAMKSLVRRSKKTTFIIKGNAIRVNPHAKSSQISRDIHSYYSTSANEKNKNFDREFCESKADIIIEDKNGLTENSSSTLLKINNVKKVRLR